MKKKFFSALSLLLVFVIAVEFFPLIPQMQVNAAEISGQEIVTATVKLTDGADKDLTGQTNIARNSTVKMRFDIAVPDINQVNAGDTYTIKIPPEIIPPSATTQPIALTDSDGDTIANVSIAAGGTVTFTFTQAAHDKSSVSAYLEITSNFDSAKLDQTTAVQIPFTVGGVTQEIPLRFTPVDPTISKSVASYNDKAGTVDWQVVINEKKATLDGYTLTDNILPGQEYVAGTLKINDSASNPLQNVDDANCYSAAAGGDTAKTGTLSYTFPAGSADTYTLTYQTKLTNQSVTDLLTKAVTVKNQAQLTQSGRTTVSSTTVSHTFPQAKLISKNGTPDSTDRTKINWVITVNEDGKALTNVTVSDDITKITNGMTWDRNFSVTDGNDLAVPGSEYTDLSAASLLKLQWSSLNATRKIKFSTTITDPNYFNNNLNQTFTNTASLDTTIGGTPVTTTGTNGVVIGSEVVSKSGAYDPATQLIKWTVVVNKNKNTIANAKITDVINGDSNSKDWQEFVDDTGHPVQISKGNQSSYTNATKGIDANKEIAYYYDGATNTFSYYFGSGSINDTYYITFYTKAKNPNVTAVNGTYNINNTATLTATGINQDGKGTATARSTVISKSGADGTANDSNYNHVTRELSWKIVVNKNKMTLPGAVVTDTIPAGQDFVNGSFVVTNNNTNSPVADATPQYTQNTPGDEKSGGTLTYTFPDPITDQYTITYKTKVTDLSVFQSNGPVKFENHASLHTTLGTADQTADAEINVNNTVVGKQGTYNNSTNYIDWNITLNSNALNLTEGTLTDQLNSVLELDTGSVHLFRQTLNPNGTLTKGAEITPLDASNISYDRSSNTFTFTLNGSSNNIFAQAENRKIPLLLTFRTYITGYPDGGSVTNTASFSGAGTNETQTGSSTVSSISSSAITSGATGTTGSLTVTKVDPKNGNKKLSGASFQLYDKYGNAVKTSEVTTGTDGTALFDKLRFGDYTLKELTPPVGYKPNSQVYSITIDGTDNKAATQTIENEQILVPIQVKKTDADGNLLAGAVFTLYDSNEQAVKTSPATDADGLTGFTNIPFGTYTIRETTAPNGYLLSATGKTVTVDDSTYQVPSALSTDFTDDKAGTITVTKTDADTGETLAGAVFQLLDAGKNPVSDPRITNPAAATGAGGVAVFSNLPYGTYYVKELTAPSHYELGALSQAIVLGGSRTEAAVTITNKQMLGKVQIKKTDTAGNPLAGAEFTIYDGSQNELFRKTSGTDGIAAFEGLPVGDYTIRETKAPEGYLRSDEALPVSVTEENYKETQTLTVTNHKAGVITVTKIDADAPAQTLSGALFQLYDSNGSPVGTPVATGEDGTAVFKGLSYGTYTVKEVKAPQGYLLGSIPLPLEITEDSTTFAAAVPNKKIFGSVQVLKTNRKGKPLAGAEFTLYGADGAALKTAATDADGTALFEALPAGSYTVKETKAPEHFQLSDKEFPVSVTAENNGTTQKIAAVNLPMEGFDDDGLPLAGPEGSGDAPKTGESRSPALPLLMAAAVLTATFALRGIAAVRRKRKGAAQHYNK